MAVQFRSLACCSVSANSGCASIASGSLETPTTRGALINVVPAKDRDRISIDFVHAKPSRRPNAFAFWTGLRRTGRNSAEPHVVIAVGSW